MDRGLVRDEILEVVLGAVVGLGGATTMVSLDMGIFAILNIYIKTAIYSDVSVRISTVVVMYSSAWFNIQIPNGHSSTRE